MSSFYGRSGPSELLPRSIFLKPLVTGRRVLELGAIAATGGATAVALLRLGARTVTSFDEDGAGIDRARDDLRGSGVSFRSGRTDELPERSFDLVLVDDAARIVAPGAAAALGRLLAPNGHLLVPIRNPAGPSLAALAGSGGTPGPAWNEVTAALRPLFPSIEVATQQLLVGYVLAPVTGREARLDIDATAGGVPAAYWLLLCGQRPSGLADQALVALPPEPLLEALGRAREPVSADEAAMPLARDGGDEAATSPPVDPTDAGTASLATRVAQLEESLAIERRRVEELHRQADRAQEGLKERENWVDGLRIEVEGREEAESRTQAELEAAVRKLARLESAHEVAQETLKRVREQLGAKVRELAAAQQGIAERTQDLRIAEEERERARSYAAEERKARLAAEAALAEAAADAEAERDRAAARCAELERTLAEAASAASAAPNVAMDAPTSEALTAERDRLAAELAERNAQLENAKRELVGHSDRIARLIAEVAELRARRPDRPFG